VNLKAEDVFFEEGPGWEESLCPYLDGARPGAPDALRPAHGGVSLGDELRHAVFTAAYPADSEGNGRASRDHQAGLSTSPPPLPMWRETLKRGGCRCFRKATGAPLARRMAASHQEPTPPEGRVRSLWQALRTRLVHHRTYFHGTNEYRALSDLLQRVKNLPAHLLGNRFGT